MDPILPWLVVLVYTVPIVGTLTSMWRRVGTIWSFGDSIRRLFPEDRVYRRLKDWGKGYNAWKERNPIASYVNLDVINLYAGKIEYAFGHFRDYTLGLYMMGAFFFDLTLMLSGDPVLRAGRFSSLFYHGLFAFLSVWTYRRHVATGLRMTEFMRVNRHAHPEEFFEHYYRHLGPWAVPIPTRARRTVDPADTSYLTGQPPKRVVWPFLRGLYDTAIFARSAYKALDTLGKEYGREVFEVMSSLWGSRMLHLFRSRLIVEGLEKFRSLSGKIILVFNHKSEFDFILNFFALSSTLLASGRSVRPRYMAAKDHFVDNRLVHTGLGVGRLIEAVDMVFVDRKGKGKNAISEAAGKLAEKEIEIAMFPQGTRALGNFGPGGERLDAGYYTTIASGGRSPSEVSGEPSINQMGVGGRAATESGYPTKLGGRGSTRRWEPQGGSHPAKIDHLKKGCAFLALETAIALQRASGGRFPSGGSGAESGLSDGGLGGRAVSPPVHIVLIGIDGTAVLMPKGAIRIQTEATVKFTIGEVLTIQPDEVAGLEPGTNDTLQRVDQLLEAIDRGLVKALNLHQKLKTRFLDEIKEQDLIPRENLLRLNHYLAQADREGVRLPFVILDRIYALPPQEQTAYLKELARRLVSGEDLFSLRERVTDRLFQQRGKEMKTIIRQEAHSHRSLPEGFR